MISFGIDIGSTTIRAAAVQVDAAPFAQQSAQIFPGSLLCARTPYETDGSLRAGEIVQLLEDWARQAGLPAPELGTLLFTGEAQRASNASEVARRITAQWDGLLSAQLDPDLETRVAAHGAGAVERSARSLGRTILHVDIGGGTSNFAWIENGAITDTSCLDLGARKWVVDPATHAIVHRSRAAGVLERLNPDLFSSAGDLDVAAAKAAGALIADLILAHAWGEDREDTRALTVVPRKRGASRPPDVLSLSGGVIECLAAPTSDPFAYGDLGPWLATAIESRARAGGTPVHLAAQAGRATALGISRHGFLLSGGSLHVPDFEADPARYRNVPLYDEAAFAALEHVPATFAIELAELRPESARFDALVRNARAWLATFRRKQLTPAHRALFLMRENLGKSFGYALQSVADRDTPALGVLDEIRLEGRASNVQTLDVGRPFGGRFPVIVKRLRLF